MVEHGRDGPVEWAAASRAQPGEMLCGDRALIADTGRGTLLAAIDGLGHGPEAALAADCAAATLAENAAEPLEALMLLCDEALRDTRGAAITVATIDHADGALRWLAVGNVSAVLLRAGGAGPEVTERVLQRAGIVGYQLPERLQVDVTTTRIGDVLLMATDGIGDDYPASADLRRPPRQLAADLLAEHAVSHDDALVVAARYRPLPNLAAWRATEVAPAPPGR